MTTRSTVSATLTEDVKKYINPQVMLAVFTSAPSTISEKLAGGAHPKNVDTILKEKDAELRKWQEQWDASEDKSIDSATST